MKLISMTDFIIEQNNNKVGLGIKQIIFDYGLILNYAKFLKQPLTLGMFIPCDENGNVLQEPKTTVYQDANFDIDEMEAWNKAKEQVLFKGFEIQSEKDGDGNNYYLFHYDWQMLVMYKINGFEWRVINDFETIENLFLNHPEIKLTESAIKSIGL